MRGDAAGSKLTGKAVIPVSLYIIRLVGIIDDTSLRRQLVEQQARPTQLSLNVSL